MRQTEIAALLQYLGDEERAELDTLLTAGMPRWMPLPGPQTLAYESKATIIGYGGAAGGGKTDLACGKSLTQHERVMILRRIGTELTAIEDRLEEIIGDRKGYNGQKMIWRLDGLQIELASVPNLGDEKKYQGRPHDLLVFDEAANFLESQVRFLLGWLRTTTPGQICQALLTFNPPTSAEGRWIVQFFAPWLDRNHRNPAKPGELRWFATVDGKDIEVEDGREFVLTEDGEICYEFRRRDYLPQQIIKPLSRTFIPSRVTDNPYLMGTAYMSTLQSLPEPLRSQMLNGDFEAGMEDDAFQVIPTAWVEAAQARWKLPEKLEPMDSMGVDVARGGKDATAIARRHDMWFNKPLKYPGTQTPDGATVAGLVVANRRDSAVVHIDVIGVGASPYDVLKDTGVQVVGVNVAEKSIASDRSGTLRFANQRSQFWWQMREALDPANNTGIALPPDSELKADLCAPRWEARGPVIQVESREAIIKRIGRSPDLGTAYILALIDTPKIEVMRRTARSKTHDPFADRMMPGNRNRNGHDPFSR